MATNTGPDSNSYQIPEVELGDTFNTWRDITNTSVYKINKIRVYDGVSSSELTATVSAGGTLTYVLADNIPNGHTFQGVIVFDSGVTFNGNVTFNAQTFTVNANNVTIDDYAIVLGATAGVTDTNINSAGGGGIILSRGGGKTAEWLWLPTDLQGGSGSWLSNSHIGFSGITWGLYPHNGTTLPVYGTGFRVQGGNTADHGVEIALSSVTGRTANRSITFSRYSPSGSTAFIDVLSGSTYGSEAFVRIREGANRKVITYGGSPGFPFGTPVRLDAVANAYAAAQASSGTNAEVIGIVSATATTMGTNRYEITMLGEIHGDFRSVTENGSSLVAGRTYYLSPYSAGKITEIQPTVPGQVHKAVLIATGASAAMVLPFTGGELGTPINIANSTSITTRINQLHKFNLGDSVRFKAYSGGVTLTYSDGAGGTAEANYAQGIYVKAQANTPDEAEIAGMVVGRGGVTGGPGAPVPIYSYFDVMIDGFFDISGTPYTALTPGDVYYLPVNCAGTSGAFESGTNPFSTSVPNIAGQVRKPLFMATSSSGGYLFSYRGDVRSETSITGASADVEQFLVDDIRSGFSGDLKIGVYDGSIRGRESIRIAAGSVFASSRGITGCVGIGPSSTWSAWNSGTNTQNRIIAPLDVYGYVRMGVTDAATPIGRVLMASRYRGDEMSGLTAQSLNVIGTEHDTGNLQINYGVIPSLGARTYASSLPAGSAVRSSLVVGRTSGAGELRFLTNDGVDAALGTAVTMTERFRITGATGYFAGAVQIGTATPGVFTHPPRLWVRGDTNTSSRPQIYMSGTDGNFLLMNASGQGGDYNGINAWNGGSYLLFGKAAAGGAGHTFAIAPWGVGSQVAGLLLSYNGTDVKVGVNTTSPTVTLDVNGDIKGTNITASGTVTVGNFGSSTNVMAKATNTAGIGRVVPLFTWSSTFGSNYELMTQTTPLGEGTWFVYLVGSVDSAGIESENPGLVMAKVWTVPASKWLTFATDGNAASNIATSDSRSGFWSKIHDSLGTLRTSDVTRANVTSTNSWTEHTVNNSNAVSLDGQNSDDNLAAQGIVYNNKWVCPVHLTGYAIRIA